MSKTSSYSEQQISNSTSRYNFYTGVVIAIISGVIFYESFKIPVEIDDFGVSARFFPQSISAFMGLLGLVLAVQGLRGSSVSDDKPKFNSAVFIKQVLPLSVLSFVYVWMFSAFGYLTATLITIFAAAYHFGVRGKALIILPVVMSVVFYYLFFILMGVFEPPAEVFDITSFLKS